MQLILHLGAHGTDEGRIAAWIARNRETFEGQGIAVPAYVPIDSIEQLNENADKFGGKK